VTEEDSFGGQFERLKDEVEIGQVLVKPVHMSRQPTGTPVPAMIERDHSPVMLGEKASPVFVPLAVLSGSVNDDQCPARQRPGGGRLPDEQWQTVQRIEMKRLLKNRCRTFAVHADRPPETPSSPGGAIGVRTRESPAKLEEQYRFRAAIHLG
jgi:hypothetical protein